MRKIKSRSSLLAFFRKGRRAPVWEKYYISVDCLLWGASFADRVWIDILFAVDGNTLFITTSLPCGVHQIVQNSSFTHFFISRFFDSISNNSFKRMLSFLHLKIFSLLLKMSAQSKSRSQMNCYLRFISQSIRKHIQRV